MDGSREVRRAGLDYLATVTALLDRIRLADARAGLFDAAEVHWWWAHNHPPHDDLEQLFWLDAAGDPVAAAVITDWGNATQLDPIMLPDTDPDFVRHVMERGLAHAADLGYESVELEVARGDDVLAEFLVERGLRVEDDGLVECWMPADNRPVVSSLADGYTLHDRGGSSDRPHHMINARRKHTDPEPRLRQSSLYRPELDLAVYHDDGDVAAYGLFWHNPVTGVGVVEPMRTEDDHQRHGLARHILTAGIARLADAGADWIKICYEPGNAAAGHLYLGAGFEPHRSNDLYAGPTGDVTP